MSNVRGVVLGAVCLCAACGDALVRAPALFSTADNVERVQSSVVFDTLWVVGGPDDTLLAMPAMPRHDGEHGMVFFDYQARRASRIGADGTVLWSWGREGEGPGEIKNVRAIDVRDDGAVLLVDSGNGRVVTLSPQGEQVGETPFRGAGTVESVAALSDGLLALQGGRAPFATWSAEGGFVNAAGPAELGEVRLLSHQGLLAHWRDQRWVLGFRLGNGWMVFDGNNLVGTHPYVEHSEFPEIRLVRQGFRRYSHIPERPRTSGRTLSVLADTLFVLFGGERPVGRLGRALDKFDLTTGRYLGSDLLPHSAHYATVGNDRLFTISLDRVFPSIVALKRTNRET